MMKAQNRGKAGEKSLARGRPRSVVVESGIISYLRCELPWMIAMKDAFHPRRA